MKYSEGNKGLAAATESFRPLARELIELDKQGLFRDFTQKSDNEGLLKGILKEMIPVYHFDRTSLTPT